LFVFVGALQLMKTGASGLAFLEPGGFFVRNAGSTLGLGWLAALVVLSGSPVAATSLTLVAAGEGAGATAALTETQGYTMLAGSRLGAAFVVLLTAVIYALRSGKGERVAPVSTAVMALCTTALIYVPAAFLGFAILKWDPFQTLNLTFPTAFGSLVHVLYGGMLSAIEDAPATLVFLGGLAALLAAFKLLDTVVPPMHAATIDQQKLDRLRKKWAMFGLGCLVALVTMSVSVALTVLVPLVAKGYAKREDILPYIMGANITTLGDTMVAAFALDSPAAVRIVLAGVLSATFLSVVLLTFFYPQIRTAIWRFQRMIVKSTPRLAIFTAALFIVPIGIVAVSGAV